MTSPSPFPNIPTSGQAPPPPNGSSGLGPSAPPPPSTPNQNIAAYMDQIRNLHITIDGLAQQYPAAAPDLQAAKQALAGSMSKVASTMNQPEQSPGTPTF